MVFIIKLCLKSGEGLWREHYVLRWFSVKLFLLYHWMAVSYMCYAHSPFKSGCSVSVFLFVCRQYREFLISWKQISHTVCMFPYLVRAKWKKKIFELEKNKKWLLGLVNSFPVWIRPAMWKNFAFQHGMNVCFNYTLSCISSHWSA